MRSRSSRAGGAIGLVAACGVVLAGCANFQNPAAGQTFKPAPTLTQPAGPTPRLPGEPEGGSRSGTPGPSAPTTSVPPPQGCTDFDKAVIATCLDTVSALAALPGAEQVPAALAGERRSGRVMQVSAQGSPVEFGSLAVDATGDGGLTGLALSPSYNEDQLVFAYITTPTDNRVVRFAKGQAPKPILTGIPRGATDNRGTIMALDQTSLLVATGDAGDPGAASDPNSLGGKILRIDLSGNPAQGNPTPASRTFATGTRSPGGLCKTADGTRLWVTDHTESADVLYKITPGGSLAAPTWSWPDKPGLGGCVDTGNSLAIASATAANVQNLPLTLDGSVGGQPSATFDEKSGKSFGRLGPLVPISEQLGLTGTLNKDGGKPVSSDDRVVVVQTSPSGGGTGDKD